MSNTRTDAEIVAVMRDGYNCRYNDEQDHIDFARAVLAKWGTPQPVVRDPLSANQVSGLAESAGYWHGDMSRADFINGIRYAEAAHGITQRGGKHVGNVD